MGLDIIDIKRIKEGYEPTQGKTLIESPVKGGFEAKSPVKGGFEQKVVSPVKGKGNDPTPNFPGNLSPVKKGYEAKGGYEPTTIMSLVKGSPTKLPPLKNSPATISPTNKKGFEA